MHTEKTHRAKKSLGQNFLKSIPALNKIVESGEIKKGDYVLEIGPGKGALTKKLLENDITVVAIEKDYALHDFLQEKFAEEIENKKLILIQADILEFDPEEYFKKNNYKIIANIPYNITGAILKKFLTADHQPECMVLMVQNEVAKRITTPNPSSTRRGGKESLLSISVKAYGEPKFIMKVPARYFSPAPKVDSAVIAIRNISRKLFQNSPLEEYPSGGGGQILHPGANATPQEGNEFEEKFWDIVKSGFAHKRKRLAGNLKGIISSEKLEKMALQNKRAEDLSLADWIKLSKEN